MNSHITKYKQQSHKIKVFPEGKRNNARARQYYKEAINTMANKCVGAECEKSRARNPAYSLSVPANERLSNWTMNKRVKFANKFFDYLGRVFPLAVRQLSSGVYGTTFVLESKNMYNILMEIRKIGFNVYLDAPKLLPNKLIIKVQLLLDAQDETRANNEDVLHRELVQKQVQCFKGYDIYPAEFVPDFYMGLTIKDFETGIRYHITAMQYIDEGVTLRSWVLNHKLTPQTFVRLERAFLAMWLLGYSHADAHDNNILVTPQGVPYLIDFGLAVEVKRKQQEFVERFSRLSIDSDFFELFNQVYSSEVSRITGKRYGFGSNNVWFNSEGLLLQMLYKWLTKDGPKLYEPCDIARARMELWRSKSSQRCMVVDDLLIALHTKPKSCRNTNNTASARSVLNKTKNTSMRYGSRI
jgi:serine/threonine protein kinase